MERKIQFQRILIIILCIALVALTIIHINTVDKKNYISDQIDLRFKTSFVYLCGNLTHDFNAIDEQQHAENLSCAFFCFSTFVLTSYSKNFDLNQIVAALYEKIQSKELYETLDRETAQKLYRLSYFIDDAELAKEVLELL